MALRVRIEKRKMSSEATECVSGEEGRKRAREDDADDSDACSHSACRRCLAPQESGAAAEEGLFYGACCSQLEELRRLLQDAHSSIKKLQAERDCLRVRVSELQRCLRSAGSSARGGTALRQSEGANSSVICLDSDDECDQGTPANTASTTGEGALASVGSGNGGAPSVEKSEAKEAKNTVSEQRPIDEEELVFVGASGELGGDLPHPRNLCPHHKFCASKDIDKVPADSHEQNKNFCSNCYCYLCDVNASKCTQWSRNSSLSHCNAHADVVVWKELRGVFRHGLVSNPALEDALGVAVASSRDLKGLLQMHRAFEKYRKGYERYVWDHSQKKHVVVKAYELQLAEPLASLPSALAFQLEGERFYCKLSEQGELRPEDIPVLLHTVDLLLGSVLSETWAPEGFPESRTSVAWVHYQRCVRGLAFLQTVLLLIVAMRGTVPAPSAAPSSQACCSNPEGRVGWSEVRAAVGDRLQALATHIRQAQAQFLSEHNCQTLLGALELPLAACAHGWSPSGYDLSGADKTDATEKRRVELRQASLRAVLAAGGAAEIECFLGAEANRDLLSSDLVGALLSRGLYDVACDVILALAPEAAQGRAASSRSWMPEAQFSNLWRRFWSLNAAAGMRLALRAALGSRVPYRPEMDKMNPSFSARSWILKKAMEELWNRCAGDDEAKAWHQAWERVSQPAALSSVESIDDIRARARELLDEAGYNGSHAGEHDRQLRHSAGLKCPDECLLTASGRLLFVEVCIEAFARMHARQQSPCCTEGARMCHYLAKLFVHPGGVVSLMNSLRPIARQDGGFLYRRRDILGELLKLSGSVGEAGGPVPAGDRSEHLNEVGLGGWVNAEVDAGRLKSMSKPVLLTVALDAASLAELRADDLKGAASVNADMARFALRQAREGCVDQALVHARNLLQGAERMRKTASNLGIARAQSDAFWGALFHLVPFCADRSDGEGHGKSLLHDLTLACFSNVPCAASSAALCKAPPPQASGSSVTDMRKVVEAAPSRCTTLAFGCYAVLGFKETALRALCVACKSTPSLVFSELAAVVRALGPLALEPSPTASAPGASCPADVRHSWLGCFIETIQTAAASGASVAARFLELETSVVGLLQIGALIEPGAVLPLLQQQVALVTDKVLAECARKLSAERMTEIRNQFSAWMAVLKTAYHTRPAIVSADLRQVWESVSFVHRRRSWATEDEHDGGGAQQDPSAAQRTLYRVRGPSLSSEWDAVVEDLKVRVGRKAGIWRHIKASGIAQ